MHLVQISFTLQIAPVSHTARTWIWKELNFTTTLNDTNSVQLNGTAEASYTVYCKSNLSFGTHFHIE